MANRRMFAKSVIDTDMFLNMPTSTQLLYFHLAIRADDDGFVGNPRMIQRMANCGDDDMKLLLAKGYVIAFESGVIVITHWNVHNTIQKDRYTPTVFSDEKKQLTREKNGAYSLSAVDTKCIQDVSNLETQYRLGKDSLDKDKLDKSKSVASAPTRHQYGQYHNVLFTDDEFAKLKEEFPDWEQRVERLSEYIASKGAKYKNHLATIRSWARKDKEKTQEKTVANPALDYAQRQYTEDDFKDFYEDLS